MIPADGALYRFASGPHNSQRGVKIASPQTLSDMFGQLERIFQVLEMLPYDEILVHVLFHRFLSRTNTPGI
jgi:hypothetical protein